MDISSCNVPENYSMLCNVIHKYALIMAHQFSDICKIPKVGNICAQIREVKKGFLSNATKMGMETFFLLLVYCIGSTKQNKFIHYNDIIELFFLYFVILSERWIWP